MTIATLDGVLAGARPPSIFLKGISATAVVGRPKSLWSLPGSPGAGLVPANTANGVVLSSSSSPVAGQVYRTDPGSGNAYLSRLQAQANQSGTLMLCDRLLQAAGTTAGTAISVTTTGAQTMTTATLPARDIAGATAGNGVQCAMEILSATGAGTATPAIGYTNQAAASGKTASLIDTYVSANGLVGDFYRFGLQAGDSGISVVNTLTLGVSMTSGSIALVLYRVLATLELIAANVPNAIDALTAGFPQLFNGTVPFFVFIPSTTTGVTVAGTYVETQG